MNTLEIYKNLKIVKIINEINVDIENVTIDTRKVEKGSCFIGIKGEKTDGNLLYKNAFEAGASLVILEYFDESPENIISKLSFSVYSEVVREGLEGYIATNSANLLEKLSDNYIMALMKDSKFVTFGPERILSYIYAKETEIKLIRIIMVGKLNNVAEEVIRERLRDSYV